MKILEDEVKTLLADAKTAGQKNGRDLSVCRVGRDVGVNKRQGTDVNRNDYKRRNDERGKDNK